MLQTSTLTSPLYQIKNQMYTPSHREREYGSQGILFHCPHLSPWSSHPAREHN